MQFQSLARQSPARTSGGGRRGGRDGVGRGADGSADGGRRPRCYSHSRRRRGRWWQRLWPTHPRPRSPTMTPRAPPRPASLSSWRRHWKILRCLKPSHRPPRGHCKMPHTDPPDAVASNPPPMAIAAPTPLRMAQNGIGSPIRHPPQLGQNRPIFHRAECLMWATKADPRWQNRASRWTPVEPLSSGTPSSVRPAPLLPSAGLVAGLCVWDKEWIEKSCI